MLDRHDPEYRQNRMDETWRLDQLWLTGKIGDPTLLRSLFIIGLLPDEANSHLNLLRMSGK